MFSIAISQLSCKFENMKFKNDMDFSTRVFSNHRTFCSYQWLKLSIWVLGIGSVIMHPGTSGFEARIKLTDSRSRPLYINVKVVVKYGGVLVISVFAPYWIVNKTGLPMLFKQEGEKTEAAGQFEEHELARMMSPLLFSFVERDSNLSLVARVGIGLNPEGKPKWCKNFFVQPTNTVRRLRVQPGSHDKRPEWVYIVGIDVRQGRGRYNVTTIITFSPRYRL